MEFVIVLKSLQIVPKEKSRCKYKFSCLLFRVRYTRPNKLLIKLRSMECQISEVQYTADHLIWPKNHETSLPCFWEKAWKKSTNPKCKCTKQFEDID